MDSPQSVVSPLKTSSVFVEPKKHNTNNDMQNPEIQSREIEFQENRSSQEKSVKEYSIGALEVYIHHARDIHNICIYQKQDVYAKLSLTSDPEKTVSTKIINGGGRNPVFNENLRLNIGKVDASLKCEIWMLSRVRNYLEDQLLGFALVPISEILLHNGKLEREFSLSSTDLFHSPAGFVQLSATYLGTLPEVIPINSPVTPIESDLLVSETESNKSVPCDLNKIEFPDPCLANENQSMVEEYFAIPCPDVDRLNSSDSIVSSDVPKNNKSSDSSLKVDSPLSSISTNEASSDSNPVSSESSETPKDSKSPEDKHVSQTKDDLKVKSTNGDAFVKPIVTVNVEPESKVVQQDIVDMYMKSMQQFTESLAKMKLPLDMDSGPTSSENSSSDQKNEGSAKNSGSRVFYGSRAFF